ncbi:MAG: porin family protein [bacterium]
MMKRMGLFFFTLLVLSMASATASSAQNRIETGVKAGVNFANRFGDIHPQDWKTGFCGGGFVAFYVNDIFAIQPEVLFSMKGSKWTRPSTFGDERITVKLNYWEIPVLAKLALPTQSTIRFTLFAGPSLGIKLSAKARVESPAGTKTEDIEEIKKTEFGVAFGVGVDLRRGKNTLTFDVRYTHGLTTIDEYNMCEDKNKVVSLMVGYAF